MEGGEHIIKNSQRNITIIIAFLFLLGMTAFIQPAMAVDVPAVKAEAQKVADFVVKKIKNTEMPPTVTMEDLNRMNVLK